MSKNEKKINLSEIKKRDLVSYSSKVRIAYKNLEDYDKGLYKPDKNKVSNLIDGKND